METKNARAIVNFTTKKVKSVVNMTIFPESRKIGYYYGTDDVTENVETEVVSWFDNDCNPYPIRITENHETKSVRNKDYAIPVFTGKNDTSISDFGLMYIYRVSFIVCLTHVLHTLGKDWTPVMGLLYLELIRRIKEEDHLLYENQVREDYEDFLQIVCNLIYDDGLTNKQVAKYLHDNLGLNYPASKISDLRKEVKATFFDNNGTAPVVIHKKHTYKMVKTSDGKKKRVEIIPKVETVLSGWYKKWLRTSKIVDDSNLATDILQEARLAIIDLVNLGLIDDYQDIWKYIRYVYKKVSNCISSQKKVNIQTNKYNPEIHGSSTFKNPESTIDDMAFDQFVDACIDDMNVRTNSIKIYRDVFRMTYKYGEKNRYIATRNSVTIRYVQKIQKNIAKYLESGRLPVREYLACSGFGLLEDESKKTCDNTISDKVIMVKEKGPAWYWDFTWK